MDKIILRMDNVNKVYEKTCVLEKVSFELHKGEFVIIQGESGCGKSTLLNVLGLLEPVSSGNYEFLGEKIQKCCNAYSSLRAEKIGFIFQEYHLIDNISVRDNILLPFLYSDKRIDTQVLSTLHTLLEELNLKELENRSVTFLSGGEKQRVAILRSIIKNPDLIIADEPTGNLDGRNTDIIVGLFKKMALKGKSVVMVTHNTNLSTYADKSYVLSKGKLQVYYE